MDFGHNQWWSYASFEEKFNLDNTNMDMGRADQTYLSNVMPRRIGKDGWSTCNMSPGLAVRLFPLPESLAIVSGMRN
jgi:hypothetical protein